MLRDHGRRDNYEHQTLGFGERLDALQAAVLGVKLLYLDDWNMRRKRAAARYCAPLVGAPLVLPRCDVGSDSVYHLFVVRVAARDRLLHLLHADGIGASTTPFCCISNPRWRISATGQAPFRTRRRRRTKCCRYHCSGDQRRAVGTRECRGAVGVKKLRASNCGGYCPRSAAVTPKLTPRTPFPTRATAKRRGEPKPRPLPPSLGAACEAVFWILSAPHSITCCC